MKRQLQILNTLSAAPIISPMLIQIENIPIYFPYQTLYPEQHEYMKELISLFATQGHCLLEMPSGTGKTISLLSATISYQLHAGTKFKIMYCSRTVGEIEKTLIELEKLIDYIKSYKNDLKFLGVGLTSRTNLCINADARSQPFSVDHACNRLIRVIDRDPDCRYYLNLEKTQSVPNGVFTLEKLIEHGKENTICPYFLARKILSLSDCIIFTYNYLIDPRIKAAVLKEIGSNSIVIFDEAHNIDNACIEAMSIELKRSDLDNANKEIKKIEAEMSKMREENKKILENEYDKIKREKMRDSDGAIPYKREFIDIDKEDQKNAITDFFNLNYEFAPGNIRNSVHFVSALRRVVEFFKTKLKTMHLTTETTNSFCKSIYDLTLIDKKTLSFLSTRLGVLIKTLKMIDTDLTSVKKITDFATLASQYPKGFSIIFEPFDTQAPTVFSPILRLYCLDASIALKGVFNYRNVIITSGTLSPLDIYAKILDFTPVKSKEIKIQLERNCISPLIITKGNDQMVVKIGEEAEIKENNENNDKKEKTNFISSSYSLRNDPSVIRNYGSLIIEFSKTVPDGMVVFFPSYIFMEEIISIWCELNIMNEILKNKLVFIETPDMRETDKALDNYKKACANGRGGILFSVARGKVSEGVDFKNEHGRCVVVMGVPYQFTESVRIKKRMEYLNSNFNLRPNEFLTFDAMRQAAQCLGRVMRGKKDYGLMVMADYRFERKDKKKKLPKWIISCLEDGNTNLSVDMAVCIARRFYREMAQELN